MKVHCALVCKGKTNSQNNQIKILKLYFKTFFLNYNVVIKTKVKGILS